MPVMGVIWTEETEEDPACCGGAQALGINAEGVPFPRHPVLQSLGGQYDAVVAMYH